MKDMIQYKKILVSLESNKIPIFLFLSSMFIFLSFAGTRIFISDEGVILNQFYSLIHGSLSLDTGKINIIKGVYLFFDGHIYGKFSYSLLILSLPFYYIMRAIEFLYGAHLFLLQLWAMCGGIIVYLILKYRNLKYAELLGAISYFIMIGANIVLFKPIYFPKWGELLSIEFTDILISSFLVVFVYLLFRNFFGDKIAMFTSFFVILATPISFYAISLKHHALTLFLTVLAFFFFYKYIEKKENKFMYFAYILAGLCVWTRVLDGAVLLSTLLITDIIIFRRKIKYIIFISLIITGSLLPFFTLNYLILGNPVSIMENTDTAIVSGTMEPGQNAIILPDENYKSVTLMRELGYSGNDEIKYYWQDILLDITFLKLNNTSGIFIISPFLIIAFAFIIDRIKGKIKLNTMDNFFGLYILLFIFSYKNSFLTIVTDTPVVLEYRYLLIIYIVLLYFAFRVSKVKSLLETNLKKIVVLYCIILAIALILFIIEFPLPFLTIYYYAALIISLSLIISISINLFAMNQETKVPLLDNFVIFNIALSLALSSLFLLFYYWVVSMTYTTPAQDLHVLPIMDNLLKWMYQTIL
ncbi:MAG: glycosyltransferase family 39 protein [Candidatus Methanoperedens sp.]|nr:glycosyltransferase family 39 protein [Candidatus Methanoperedens sp.]